MSFNVFSDISILIKKKKERKDLKIQEKVGKIFDMDIKVF